MDNTRIVRQLQEALDYCENIISTIREPLVVLDPKLRIISANQSFYQSFSVTPTETEGKLIYEVGNGQWNIPKLRELLEEILPKNTKFDDFVFEHEFPNLGRRIMLLNARRIHDGGTQTQKILLAIEDMTDHRQTQHDLASSELRYRRLFETAQDGILILNAESGEITDANPFLSNMLGYSREELLGKKLWEIGFFKDTAASHRAFQLLQDKGYVRYEDLPLQSKGGQPMAVEFVSNVYSIDDEKVIQCNIRDITERKKIEKAQRESEEKFRQLFYSMNEGTAIHEIIYDDSGQAIDYVITDVNPAYESITGLKKETIVGRKSSEVYGVNEPPYLDIYAQVASSGEPTSFETYFPPMEKYFSISVYNPERGKFATIFSDITERKLAEKRINDLNVSLVRHTTELESANEELEAFSYSVSHDLRAPLRGISGFSRAVIEEYNDKLDEQGKDYLNRVRDASQHMSDLINDLLRLSRLSRAEINIEDVNLSELTRSIVEVLSNVQPERKAEFIISSGITVKGDKSLLTIALQNLLGNSWKFTNKCPLARIEFGVTAQNGEKIYFIRDNGAGFNMQYSNKLFQPFQRLHSAEEFEGTGIGLAIVQRVVRRHGGRVWAESEPGKETTFYFTLG